MSNKRSKEIECLMRLDELNAIYDEILDFMNKEDLITRPEAVAIRSSSEIPKMIHAKLQTLSKANKIQLLEYEWVILPMERIKIVVVTDRNSREFSYGF